MVGRSFFALTQAFFGISPALLYLVAGLELNAGHAAISAGTIVAFTTLQTRLLMPINQLLQVSVDVQSSLALFGRIFEYLDLEPRIVDAPGAVAIDPATARGAVELDQRRVLLRRPRSTRPSPRRRPRRGWRCTTSRSRSSPGSSPPSSARAARARRRSPTSSPGSTT